jgi:hypothetical protein
MINDPIVRWIVTLLFVFSAGVCISAIVRNRRSTPTVITNSLHAVMAIAMAVMAWPRGADIAPRGPMLFFLAAAGWFAVVPAKADGHQVRNTYHAVMMIAMAWMYAAMGGLHLRSNADPASTAMPEMDMAGMSTAMDGGASHAGHTGHMVAAYSGAGPVTWLGSLNWLCAIGFAGAAVFWLYRFIATRMQASGDESHSSFGTLCQFAMAAGTAVMFGVML